MTADGIEALDAQLGKLGRPVIRRIVEAGARADADEWRANIRQAGHIRTGDMLGSVAPGDYTEDPDGGEIFVYPRDTDRKGVRNATKAYVINYGRGKCRGKLGDRFITGKLQQTEEKVFQAMQAESDRILDELNN
jgi:hypothetical protein